MVDEKDHPYTGTQYAWVRARCLGGKTNIWGRLALRLSDYDFKAASRDGYGEDWPISYADIAPYYDKVDLISASPGHKENLPYLPDSLFQRAVRLNPAEVKLRASLAKCGRVLTPYRAGVTTDGLKHNKYRSRCYGRGACDRRVGGCDIHAAFDSPTGLIYPALGHRQSHAAHQCHRRTKYCRQEHRQGQRRLFHRHRDRQDLQAKGRSGAAGGLDAGVRAPDAALEIRPASQRHRQLQRPRGP